MAKYGSRPFRYPAPSDRFLELASMTRMSLATLLLDTGFQVLD
jgi:hypothetical protein